jgi:hypothetical protein
MSTEYPPLDILLSIMRAVSRTPELQNLYDFSHVDPCPSEFNLPLAYVGAIIVKDGRQRPKILRLTKEDAVAIGRDNDIYSHTPPAVNELAWDFHRWVLDQNHTILSDLCENCGHVRKPRMLQCLP